MTDNKLDLDLNLESLTPAELKILSGLIKKVSNKKKPPIKRKPRTKPKPKVNDTEIVDGPQLGRTSPSKKIVETENEKVPTNSKAKGRTKPTKEYNKKRTERGGKKGRANKKMARTETVVLSGKNEFLNMGEKNSHKDDTRIDRLLWKNKEVNKRPPKYSDVEVQCKECKLWYDVNPSLIYVDPETNETNFTCHNCIRR